jgi:AAA family ATP:ADP antiporter
MSEQALSSADPDKTLVEKLLNLFTEVRSGEAATALLLATNIFLILTAYYIVKPVREALILSTSGGAEIKSYAAAGQALLLLGAVPAYAWLANRYPRRQLINTVTLFFAACLVAFYFLAIANAPIAIVFFLWVGIFNLMVPAQFWAFANDLYTPEDGKRLFVIVAFGASAGAVFGSYLAGQLIDILGVNQLLLASAAVLVLSLLLTNLIDSREKRRVAGSGGTLVEEEPLSRDGAFQLLLRSRYLLLIALLMLVLNWVNTTGEYILGRTVRDAALRFVDSAAADGSSVEDFIGAFYANFFAVVNVLGLLLQLFVVSRVLKYLGVRIAIFIFPLIAMGGYMLAAFYPVLAIIRAVKIAENSTDYSLQNTVRQVLFLPTTRDQKYKAKQAIDTFFQRGGDVLSAVTVFVGSALLALSTQQFAMINIVLVAAWLAIAWMIAREHRRLVPDDSAPATGEPA